MEERAHHGYLHQDGYLHQLPPAQPSPCASQSKSSPHALSSTPASAFTTATPAHLPKCLPTSAQMEQSVCIRPDC